MENSEVDLLAIENDSHSLDMTAIYTMGMSHDSKSDFMDDDEDTDDTQYGDDGFNKSTEGIGKGNGKARYKHVPHREKPVQVVARRNARERRRVQTVNGAFSSLRKHIPYENRHKRLSKVKTLRIAIDYIHELQTMLHDHDSLFDGMLGSTHLTAATDLLQSTLNGAHAHPSAGMATLSNMQTLHALPTHSAAETLPMSSLSPSVNSIPTTLFTGTGSLLDLMTSSNMHHQLQTQAGDWSNPTKEIPEFLHISE